MSKLSEENQFVVEEAFVIEIIAKWQSIFTHLASHMYINYLLWLYLDGSSELRKLIRKRFMWHLKTVHVA